MKMSEYLTKNVNTSISKIIFGIRSKTFDVKEYNPWRYKDDLCVMCLETTETMEHFAHCKGYGETIDMDWKLIYGNNMEEQVTIGEFMKRRFKMRQEVLQQQEDGLASVLGSTAPGTL